MVTKTLDRPLAMTPGEPMDLLQASLSPGFLMEMDLDFGCSS